MDLCDKMHIASWRRFQMNALILVVMMQWNQGMDMLLPLPGSPARAAQHLPTCHMADVKLWFCSKDIMSMLTFLPEGGGSK